MPPRNKSTSQERMFRPAVSPMPEGYYSGDQPNPNMRAFVEAHLQEHPYDPTNDDYDVAAFDLPIETTKATAIYNMHSYHQGKKPHDAIRQYIRHYTQPGDLVLDCFSGSGSTALAALLEGRAAVAIDRSPAATFITKNYCTPVDPATLQHAFDQFKSEIQDELDWLYVTRCNRCDGPAMTTATIYSQVFQCPRCLTKVPLFDCVKAENAYGKEVNACQVCHGRGIVEEISTRTERFGAAPVRVRYICQNGCQPAEDERSHNDLDRRKRDYFARYDLEKIAEVGQQKIPYWHPDVPMIKGFETTVKRDLKAQGVSTVSELYTKRNLWAMALYIEAANRNIGFRDNFHFALTSISLAMSKMQGYVEDPRFPNQLMRGTYYIPPTGREYNVGIWLEGKICNLIAGYQKIANEIQSTSIVVSTQSATSQANIPSNSVDYIFTDPPYADKVQYGELNFVWEAWLNLDTHWHDDEIIINSVRGKTEADWASMMRLAMAECYRVLKPGRWLSLCYHDTSAGTWQLVQDIMAEVGFVVDKTESALFISTSQKSFNQLTAEKVTKRDLVINFRKPRPGEAQALLTISGDEDSATFGEKVHAIIRAFLADHPGSSKDRIYDEVVSRMVRAGQMEAHNFDALLAQVAEAAREPVMANLFEQRQPDLFGAHEIVRWYLKETALAVEDAAESAREEAAAKRVRGFVERKGVDLAMTGVHYSDIFEHYVYTITDKPRRALADWLIDYFYKTDAGTYRAPLNDAEETEKAQARAVGINRRIRRYVSYLRQGIVIPERERASDATLVEWIRQCKRAALYEDGKLLYERGGLDLDRLSEELMVSVEEDYQTCMRMLARAASAAGEEKARRGRKKADQQSMDI